LNEPVIDVGQALMRWFGLRGLSYPPVPEFAIPLLQVQAPQTLATEPVDPMNLYLFNESADQVLHRSGVDRFAVSFAGHGMNSYAWTILLERPGLRLLAQVGFGGAFGDPGREADALSELFSWVFAAEQEVPYDLDRDVVVLSSDIRSVRATGWAPSEASTTARVWRESADSSHPLLVIDDLVPREVGWPPRRSDPEPAAANRAELLARQAAVTYEWSRRFPEAADGEVDDPEADLALSQAMMGWVDGAGPHAWLPAVLGRGSCWWCGEPQDHELHG
jgi:hypothetical protein